jgi:Fic family protein
MPFSDDKEMIDSAIESSDLLSVGQKEILKTLVRCEEGLSVPSIMKILGASKQALHFNIKKLLEREYLTRIKDRIYVYRSNKVKIKELIELHLKKVSIKNNM